MYQNLYLKKINNNIFLYNKFYILNNLIITYFINFYYFLKIIIVI